MNIENYKNQIIKELEKIEGVYNIILVKECRHIETNGVMLKFAFEHKKHIDATCYATCYVDINYNFKTDEEIVKNVIYKLKREISERIKEYI